jgi:hypothetical protein
VALIAGAGPKTAGVGRNDGFDVTHSTIASIVQGFDHLAVPSLPFVGCLTERVIEPFRTRANDSAVSRHKRPLARRRSGERHGT